MSERDDLLNSMLTAEDNYVRRARNAYSDAVIAFLKRFGAKVAEGKWIHPPFRLPSGEIVQPIMRRNVHGKIVGYLARRKEPAELREPSFHGNTT